MARVPRLIQQGTYVKISGVHANRYDFLRFVADGSPNIFLAKAPIRGRLELGVSAGSFRGEFPLGVLVIPWGVFVGSLFVRRLIPSELKLLERIV